MNNIKWYPYVKLIVAKVKEFEGDCYFGTVDSETFVSLHAAHHHLHNPGDKIEYILRTE